VSNDYAAIVGTKGEATDGFSGPWSGFYSEPSRPLERQGRLLWPLCIGGSPFDLHIDGRFPLAGYETLELLGDALDVARLPDRVGLRKETIHSYALGFLLAECMGFVRAPSEAHQSSYYLL
jgi:hypothetical protein